MFFLIIDFLVPSFGDYIYYFEMDIVGFTKMQYALLMMFGFLTLITGSILFSSLFKESNLRCVIFIGVLINFTGALLTVCFVKQMYFGLSPMMFVICTSTVTDSLV
jgi:cytochrome b subunit of formate dehydrogenase